MVKFKDIFWFAPKSRIKAGEGLDKGRFPFYTSSAIQNKWIDTEQHFDEALIFGTGGSASIHYESQPFSTSTDCFVTITKRRDVNTKYVYYFLSSNIHLLERGFKGAGLKHLSKAYLEEIEIPLPDLETQNKIVAILDKATAIWDKREETIRKCDELLRATFLEMFGDPIKNKFGFKKVYVDDISIAIKDGPHVSPNYVDQGIPILSTRNIKPGQLLYTDIKFVSEETYEKLTKYFKPSKHDVIITKGGTTGYAKVIDWNFKFCIWVHLAVVRLKPEVNPYYFESFINSDYGYYQTQRFTHGIANRDLGLKRIAKIELLLPPLEMQEKFATIYSKIAKVKSKLENSKEKVEFLISSLSQLAFKGELDFNTAVDLEVLLENDYQFFKENSNSGSIKLLIERLNTDELNENRFYEQQTYDKAKSFVFELIKEGKVKQVFDDKTKKVKLTI